MNTDVRLVPMTREMRDAVEKAGDVLSWQQDVEDLQHDVNTGALTALWFAYDGAQRRDHRHRPSPVEAES